MDPKCPVFKVAQQEFGRAAPFECLKHRSHQPELFGIGLAVAGERRRHLGQHGTGGLAPRLGLHLGEGAHGLELFQGCSSRPSRSTQLTRTCVRGSSRPPKRRRLRRAERATARSRPWDSVRNETIRSASPRGWVPRTKAFVLLPDHGRCSRAEKPDGRPRRRQRIAVCNMKRDSRALRRVALHPFATGLHGARTWRKASVRQRNISDVIRGGPAPSESGDRFASPLGP